MYISSPEVDKPKRGGKKDIDIGQKAWQPVFPRKKISKIESFFLDNINFYYVEKIIYVLSMLFSLKSHGPLYKLTEFHKNNCNQLISCEVAKVLNIIADVLQF